MHRTFIMTNKILVTAIFIGIFAFGAFAQKAQRTVATKAVAPPAETAPAAATAETADAVKAANTVESRQATKDLAYRNWLERDVLYLITPAEKEAFLSLRTDREREEFVENFWRRRDPSPKTAENEFRDEYYGRIAYANEHFQLTPGTITGWQSDRGKTYILMGAPDQIEKGRASFANLDDIAFEKWIYQGKDLNITFIDPAGDNEFRFLEKGSENLLGAAK